MRPRPARGRRIKRLRTGGYALQKIEEIKMSATVIATENYDGLRIDIYQTTGTYGYNVFSVNNYRVCSDEGYFTSDDAMEAAKEKLDREIAVYYDIALTDHGKERLRKFLEENFYFSQNALSYYTDKFALELEDAKYEAGIGYPGIIKIHAYDRQCRNSKDQTYSADDSFFRVVKYTENDFQTSY